MDFGAFFRACRSAGHAFDMTHRTGAAFAVPDTPAAAALSVLHCGKTAADAAQGLARALEFVHGAALHAGPKFADDCADFVAGLEAVRAFAERVAPQDGVGTSL